MIKNTFTLLFVFALTILQAQDYQISFTGIGASTTVDTVHVQNITQGTFLTLNGSDVLHLSGTVGIQQLKTNTDKDLLIYPNPMTFYTNIEFEIPKASMVTIELYDLRGKKVTSIRKDLKEGFHTYNVTGLNRGVYSVSIHSDGFNYSGKIISNNSTSQGASINYSSRSSSFNETDLKSNKEVISMHYNEGDLLHFRGISGDYVTVVPLIPSSSTTVTFNFIEAVDVDGNHYATITIGTQTWMLENLKTTTYNDGEAIPEWTFGEDWYNGSNPVAHYQWANTDDLNNLYEEELPFDFYGAIYNEVSLASGKLAPIGWRIPSEQDFIELENYISNDGYSGDEATVLKSPYGWAPSANNGTDIYGFNGLPNGYVAAGGTATGSQVICSWATSDNPTEQTRRIANLFDEPTILYFDNGIQLGAGLRCIKE